jgi:hypothetical protein
VENIKWMKGMTEQMLNGVLRKSSTLVVAALFVAGISTVTPASATAQSGTLTVNFHYQRTDQTFNDWKAWIWCKDGSGNFGTNLFQGSNPASGDCTKGAYLSLHSSDAVAEVVQQFTISDAVDVSQLGVIIYKHQGPGDVGNNTRDTQSKNDRLFDLVATATDVVTSDSVATFVTTEYVAPNPSPSDSPSPDPSVSDSASPNPSDSPSPDPSASDSPSPDPSVSGSASPSPSASKTTVPVVAKIPTVKSFSQSKSTKRGVGTVTVVGTNLAGATVKVGSLKATVKSSTATKLIFTIPAKAAATTKGKFTITLGSKSVSSKSTLKITLK